MYFVVGIGVMIVLFVIVIKMYWDAKATLAEYLAKTQEREESIRKTAIESSRYALRGQVTEELIPLAEGFPYKLSDCKFFGQPIDYVVFQGLSDFRDGKGEEISIIIADVKTGNAKLSRTQRGIRDAILAGRIKFETWKYDNENKLSIK